MPWDIALKIFYLHFKQIISNNIRHFRIYFSKLNVREIIQYYEIEDFILMLIMPEAHREAKGGLNSLSRFYSLHRKNSRATQSSLAKHSRLLLK